MTGGCDHDRPLLQPATLRGRDMWTIPLWLEPHHQWQATNVPILRSSGTQKFLLRISL
jgi:hypothetical protein